MMYLFIICHLMLSLDFSFYCSTVCNMHTSGSKTIMVSCPPALPGPVIMVCLIVFNIITLPKCQQHNSYKGLI